jgi:8-oxo-dGTP diphosphatase
VYQLHYLLPVTQFSYSYPRAALTVDCVVFGFSADALDVLLVRRGIAPFKGQWALPGGFVRIDETLEDAARRELREETGLRDLYLEQLCAVGTLDRDPRERVVSICYAALVKRSAHAVQAATDAVDARWHTVARVPKLAFDHAEILARALGQLRVNLRREPVGFELLPENFSLAELQHLYEAVLGTELDKRNFRKKVVALDLLVPVAERREGLGRPAQLFRFDPKKYARLKKKGFHFEL